MHCHSSKHAVWAPLRQLQISSRSLSVMLLPHKPALPQGQKNAMNKMRDRREDVTMMFLRDVSLSPQTKQQAFPAWDSHQPPHAGDQRHYWRATNLHLHFQSFWSCSPKSFCFPQWLPAWYKVGGLCWLVQELAGEKRWLPKLVFPLSTYMENILNTKKENAKPQARLEGNNMANRVGCLDFFFLETEICTI